MATKTFSSLHGSSAATDRTQPELVKANQTCILNVVQMKQRYVFYKAFLCFPQTLRKGYIKYSPLLYGGLVSRMTAVRSSVGARFHESSVTGATEVATAAATENEGVKATSVLGDCCCCSEPEWNSCCSYLCVQYDGRAGDAYMLWFKCEGQRTICTCWFFPTLL